MHDRIAFGVFTVNVYIFALDQRYFVDALFGRVECIVDDLLNQSDLIVIYTGCKVDLEVFELIEEFADIHIDHFKGAEFSQKIAQVDGVGTDDLYSEIVAVADVVGEVFRFKRFFGNLNDPLRTVAQKEQV